MLNRPNTVIKIYNSSTCILSIPIGKFQVYEFFHKINLMISETLAYHREFFSNNFCQKNNIIVRFTENKLSLVICGIFRKQFLRLNLDCGIILSNYFEYTMEVIKN